MALPRLTRNQQLAALALLLGIVAIPARPYSGTTVTLDTRELAAEVAREADHVDPLDVADWIIKGRSDYRLVDIRSEAEYAAYHIPTAENIPLATLTDAPLGRHEKIVIYSEGGIHSAQAWMLLRARDFKGVYMLRGGLEAWNDEVLFPTLTEHPTAFQAERDAKLTSISAHFGGAPATGDSESGAATAAARVMPKVEAPSSTGAVAPKATKKKKEGC